MPEVQIIGLLKVPLCSKQEVLVRGGAAAGAIVQDTGSQGQMLQLCSRAFMSCYQCWDVAHLVMLRDKALPRALLQISTQLT